MTTFLITGNLGYIGPVLEKNIRNYLPSAIIIGLDTGYFRDSIISHKTPFSRPNVDVQYYIDIRNSEIISDIINRHSVDHILHLAAISNDPMGCEFEEVTSSINHYASVNLAKLACSNHVKSFVFASSCSVYGMGGDSPKTEADSLNPLTAYAKSKVAVESDILSLNETVNSKTKFTCLRFATACGMSPRLRLDLVLNDFVATALSTYKIDILSNGVPWRPLIDVNDMSKLMIWGALRDGSNYEIFNAGCQSCNYQVLEIAKKVASALQPNVSINVNESAPIDNRSYQVNFQKLLSVLTTEFTPSISLSESIDNLVNGLKYSLDYVSPTNREHLIRLKTLINHRAEGRLDGNLLWLR